MVSLNDWPDCPKDNCINKVCMWANTGLCYPHSLELHGKEIMDFMYDATHDEEGNAVSNHVDWVTDYDY